uniref:Putative secreted protein n=1 Tax=Ixodes ricinus TaxID=34613 RepID=A0A6B0U7Z4_IXORI
MINLYFLCHVSILIFSCFYQCDSILIHQFTVLAYHGVTLKGVILLIVYCTVHFNVRLTITNNHAQMLGHIRSWMSSKLLDVPHFVMYILHFMFLSVRFLYLDL